MGPGMRIIQENNIYFFAKQYFECKFCTFGFIQVNRSISIFECFFEYEADLPVLAYQKRFQDAGLFCH